MKSSFFLTLFISFFSLTFAFAQVPQAINYQAVIRTDSGLVVPNKSVNVRLSVQDGLTTPPQYVELHTVTTNQFGLVTLSIGKGAALTGVFSQINWGVGEKFLKTEVDLNRTGSYTIIGVQQFLSVPYALYAEKAGNVSATNDGWKVTGNAATTGQFLGTTNAQDLKIFTNNFQRAIFAADGAVGIGVNFPAALLHTNGTLKFAGLLRDDAKNNLLAVDNVGNVGWRDAASFMGSSGWLLNGNTATATSFIGTNNAQDFRFNTEGSQKMVIKTTGNVGIGTSTPLAKLSVEGLGDGTGALDDRTIVSINNRSTSFASQANLKLTAGNTTAQTILTHISPTYTVYNGYADYGELTSSGKGLILQAPVGEVRIQTGLYSGGVKDRLTVTNNGNVGIGTRTPSHRLRVETNSDETGSDDRVQMQLHNSSNNNEALAGLGISSGNTGTNTWLEHVGANYNVYSAAYSDFNDLGYLASTGLNGLMMMSYPNNSKMRFAVGTANNIPVTRMSLSTVGLGLGTAEPTAQLHNVGTARFEGLSINNAGSRVVVADGSGNLALRDVSTLPTGGGGGGTGWLLTGNTTNASNYIGTNNSDDLRVFTEGSQKMVVKTSGNVGIGTTTPLSKLSIEGTGDGTGALDDRTIVSINNNSTSFASQANLKITAGNTISQTILTHISPTYTVYNGYADYGELTSSGSGLILQAPVGAVHIQTGLYSGGVQNRLTVINNGNVGIGTVTPKAKLEVATGDVYLSDPTKGIILKSPNGNCWRVTIDNTGNFVRTAITCPQ